MEKVLLIDNIAITEDPIKILEKLRSELTNGKLEFFQQRGSGIQVQCPVHGGGHEKHGSCYININSDSAPYLWVHCFTCGESCNFIKFCMHCFDSSYEYAKQWLIDNFGDTYVSFNVASNLTDINLEHTKPQYLDESVLDTFESYHPYMKKRGLSDEVIKQFEIKYDILSKAIVFPVRDRQGKLIALTKRSIEGKKFTIDKDFDKSNIYLMYDILKNNTKEVYLVESQINALVLRSWGYPSMALFGASVTGSQIKQLNKLGVRHYILALDPDDAGRKGTKKLVKCLDKSIFVDVINMPEGKDVADLTKEEFESLIN